MIARLSFCCACLGGLAALHADATGRDLANGSVFPLNSGPVHEAFASPVSLNPAPLPPASKAPPDAIDETPPAARPNQDGAVWIGGYWEWDAVRNDFVWVSGTWCSAPAGQRWVAGYWQTSANGNRRIPGFWMSATAKEIDYLPLPPASQETGPRGIAPTRDHFWSPGYWKYERSGFRWQPGYWAQQQTDWTWVAPHYSWTPQGAVLTGGYWDSPLSERGMLFSPVQFASSIESKAESESGYVPDALIDADLLVRHLFLGPGGRSYHFGDYYASRFERAGYEPWYAIGDGGYSFDPIYNYRSWRLGRDNLRWHQALQRDYESLAWSDSRPAPKSLDTTASAAPAVVVVDRLRIGSSLIESLRGAPAASPGLTQLDEAQLSELQLAMREVRNWAAERARSEAAELDRRVGSTAVSAPAPLPLPPLPNVVVAGNVPPVPVPGGGVFVNGMTQPGGVVVINGVTVQQPALNPNALDGQTGMVTSNGLTVQRPAPVPGAIDTGGLMPLGADGGLPLVRPDSTVGQNVFNGNNLPNVNVANDAGALPAAVRQDLNTGVIVGPNGIVNQPVNANVNGQGQALTQPNVNNGVNVPGNPGMFGNNASAFPRGGTASQLPNRSSFSPSGGLQPPNPAAAFPDPTSRNRSTAQPSATSAQPGRIPQGNRVDNPSLRTFGGTSGVPNPAGASTVPANNRASPQPSTSPGAPSAQPGVNPAPAGGPAVPPQ